MDGVYRLSQTHVTYLGMLAVFGAGLWGILRAGAALPAARDIAGEWRMTWRQAQHAADLPDRMSVDQSGRYVVITVRKDSRAVARMQGQLRAQQLAVRATDQSWDINGTLEPAATVVHGTLGTPTRFAFDAVRIDPAAR